MASSADSKSHPGRIPDAFEERLDRADRARGDEYLDEQRLDRLADQAPKCAWLRCSFPAVVGSYCGMHSGMELRSRQAPQAVKPVSEQPAPEPTSPVLLGALDFLAKTEREKDSA